MKDRLLLISALGLGAITGGGAVVQHEQDQSHRIQLLENSVSELRGENTKLWGNVCRSQALTDLTTQGETDISPDKDGLKACKDDSKQWITIFEQEPKAR